MENRHIADILFVINTYFPGFIIDKIYNDYGYWEIDIRKPKAPFPSMERKHICMDTNSYYSSKTWRKVWERRYADMSLPLGERRWIVFRKDSE